MNLETTFDETPLDRDEPTILIVDDEKFSRESLELICEQTIAGEKYQTILAPSISDAIRVLSKTHVHVMLLDKNLGPDETCPTENGILSIKRFLAQQSHLKILVITGSKSEKDKKLAMEQGAFGYVNKEMDASLILAEINNAIKHARLEVKAHRIDFLESENEKATIPGSSLAATRLKRTIQQVSKTRAPVLLLGEPGSGKNTIAKYINRLRKMYLKQVDRPFIDKNMATIPDNLAEGELFGWEKGAFTGADKTKLGLVELANKGTLFLDEIGTISLDLQAKLLRVLEEGTFTRLGSGVERYSQFKLVCATNKDLKAAVRDGTFRRDLYERISILEVTVPPLSERSEDIPEIIRTLLPKCCEIADVQITFDDLPGDFIEYLVKNPPSGNIRAIKTRLIRLLAHSDNDRSGRRNFKNWRKYPGLTKDSSAGRTKKRTLTLDDLLNTPFDVVNDGFPGLRQVLEALRGKIILEAIEKNNSSQIRAAKALKINNATVSTFLKQKKLSVKSIKSTAPTKKKELYAIEVSL